MNQIWVIKELLKIAKILFDKRILLVFRIKETGDDETIRSRAINQIQFFFGNREVIVAKNKGSIRFADVNDIVTWWRNERSKFFIEDEQLVVPVYNERNVKLVKG